MKNRTQMMRQRSPMKTLDWLEEQEDDFLMGKTASEFQDIGEDEE